MLEIISRDKILHFKNTLIINYSLPIAVPTAMLSKVTKTASEKQLLKPEANDSSAHYDSPKASVRKASAER